MAELCSPATETPTAAGLTGRFPDVAELVAAKMQVFNVQNTSLVQCDADHIDALVSDPYGKVSFPCNFCCTPRGLVTPEKVTQQHLL